MPIQRLLLKLLPILVLSLLLSSNAYATNWCEDGDVDTCWTIETGSGTTWDDKSSNNVDATLQGGDPAFDLDVPGSGDGFEGSSTYSMDFDGNGDVLTSTFRCNASAAQTFVLWVNTDTYQATDRMFEINTNHHGLLHYSSKPNWWASGFDLYAGLDNIPEGEWEHYATTYNTSADTARIYVNAVLKESDTNIDAQSCNLFNIGGQPGDARYMDGRIDEFAIFATELDGTDINDIYENGLVQVAGGNPVSPETLMQGNVVAQGNVIIQ